MREFWLEVVFWGGVGMVVYTFAGYAAISWFLARLAPRIPQLTEGEEYPALSVVLAARNEEGRIRARIENLLACRYDAGKLEIIVVSNGSEDATVENARAVGSPLVRVLALDGASGKSGSLNAGVEAAKGKIIVFCDARQRFAEDALEKLVENFRDPAVGAVSGALEVEASPGGAGRGVDLYWRLERGLRHTEALRDSSVGCTGAIYAIRREWFREIPGDTILDDVVIPMEIAGAGHRVLFEPRALAFDPLPLAGKREMKRKQRTLAGNFQMLFRYPHWVLPWGHRLWWRLISHKYLRLASPYFLVALLISSLLLSARPLYAGCLALQVTGYAIAVLGLVFPRVTGRLAAVPAGFVFLNVQSFLALCYYLAHRKSAGWHRGGKEDG